MSFLTPPLHTGEGWQGARNHILLVSMWFEVSKMNPCPRPTLPLWPVFDPKITHFWGVHSWCMAMAKNTSNQLGICPWKMHVRPMPKLSIFIAVTTKKRRKKTKKQAKTARFWPKARRTTMARETFFINVYGWLSFVPSLVAPRFLGRPGIPILS